MIAHQRVGGHGTQAERHIRCADRGTLSAAFAGDLFDGCAWVPTRRCWARWSWLICGRDRLIPEPACLARRVGQCFTNARCDVPASNDRDRHIQRGRCCLRYAARPAAAAVRMVCGQGSQRGPFAEAHRPLPRAGVRGAISPRDRAAGPGPRRPWLPRAKPPPQKRDQSLRPPSSRSQLSRRPARWHRASGCWDGVCASIRR